MVSDFLTSEWGRLVDGNKCVASIFRLNICSYTLSVSPGFYSRLARTAMAISRTWSSWRRPTKCSIFLKPRPTDLHKLSCCSTMLQATRSVLPMLSVLAGCQKVLTRLGVSKLVCAQVLSTANLNLCITTTNIRQCQAGSREWSKFFGSVDCTETDSWRNARDLNAKPGQPIVAVAACCSASQTSCRRSPLSWSLWSPAATSVISTRSTTAS